MSDAVIITEDANRQVVEADAGTQVVEQVLSVNIGGGGADQTARDAAAAAQATANAALPKAGGTMTGKITLDGDPSSALHAAPKQYVDTKQDAATAATDAELTAHASDTTSVHGIADTAALALTADVQPLDSDLTAIAALSTTAYGRSLLALADAAAGRAALASTYRSVILADSPLLYWRLGSGGATDQSGNGLNGTAQGGLTIGGAAGAIVGDADTATDLDGVNDEISIAHSSTLNGPGTTISYSLWCYIDVLGGVVNGLIDKNNGGNGYYLEVLPGATVRARIGATLYDTTQKVPVGRWTHIAFTWDGAVGCTYLNGKFEASAAITGSISNSNSLRLGMRYDGYYTNCKLDEFAIFPSALSSQQVMRHYLAGIGALTT